MARKDFVYPLSQRELQGCQRRVKFFVPMSAAAELEGLRRRAETLLDPIQVSDCYKAIARLSLGKVKPPHSTDEWS